MSEENPFPARAVTRFGIKLVRPADLRYMREAFAYVTDYLKRYPHSGGAVKLSGAHGSGKTFVLTWIAERAGALISSQSRVLYAKADTPSLNDLYAQLMLPLSREELAKLLRAMLVRQAKQDTSRAAATAQTHAQITETGDLEQGYASREIDRNEVARAVRIEIEFSSENRTVSRRVAAAISLLDDPDFGEAAFEWLAGRPAKLPNELLQSPLFGPAVEGTTNIVIGALEVLAALFKFGGCPLILLVDQMENLLDPANVPGSSSALKKLTEQVGGQAALLFFAGTPNGWGTLPRDSVPRFLNPEPVEIGNLSYDEAGALLRAYLPLANLDSSTVETLRDLAAANPREILQTSYEVFVATNGNFAMADRDVLRLAAEKSGTLQDRTRVAVEIIDRLATRYGLRTLPAPWDGISTFDRLIVAPGGASMGVLLAVTADRQAEARFGRRLTELKRQSVQSPGDIKFVVVAVGYSSEQVRSLLSGISSIFIFNESSLSDDLSKEFSILAAAPPIDWQTNSEASKSNDAALLQRIARLERDLAMVERVRVRADETTSDRLVSNTIAVSAPERQATEIRTRQELRQGLDDLSDALNGESEQREKQLIRGLLVANEANIGDRNFDFLGSLYLDALETERIAAHRDAIAPATSPQVRAHIDIQEFRSDLIASMRKCVSSSSWQMLDSWKFRLVLSFGFALIAAFYLDIMLSLRWHWRTDPEFSPAPISSYETVFFPNAIGSFVLGIFTGPATYYFLDYYRRPQHRFRRLALLSRELRKQASETRWVGN